MHGHKSCGWIQVRTLAIDRPSVKGQVEFLLEQLRPSKSTLSKVMKLHPRNDAIFRYYVAQWITRKQLACKKVSKRVGSIACKAELAGSRKRKLEQRAVIPQQVSYKYNSVNGIKH